MGDKQTISIQGLRQLAATYRQNAVECGRVGAFLGGQTDLFWTCDEASKFTKTLSKYHETLSELQDEFTALAKEVARRADTLAASQR